MPPATAKPCPRQCVSGAAGCWATAPAAARAARSPPSSSTTGCAAAAGRCGCPPPTSCSRTRAATGPRSAAAKPTSSHWASSARGPIFLKSPESCSPPMQPCARPPARESARASNRSWAGSRMAWTKTPAMPLAASSCSTRRTPWPTPPGQGIARRYGPLATGPRRIAFAERLARCPYPLCLRHRGHHRARPGLCAAPRPVGRRGFRRRDALRATHRFRHRHGGRRGRGDGGGGPRSEGPRALPGPCAQL